ncbi:hypothetical protein LCGC14_1980950 [marine sediment metagenome]|uniref:Uncharacterized protein n=1 Tax=marine sediment metagenome TaxID=412755 RepID=A0A0F9F8X6_9ZZZZ
MGRAFVTGLKRILGEKLHGLYTYGAAAFPGADRRPLAPSVFGACALRFVICGVSVPWGLCSPRPGGNTAWQVPTYIGMPPVRLAGTERWGVGGLFGVGSALTWCYHTYPRSFTELQSLMLGNSPG